MWEEEVKIFVLSNLKKLIDSIYSQVDIVSSNKKNKQKVKNKIFSSEYIIPIRYFN